VNFIEPALAVNPFHIGFSRSSLEYEKKVDAFNAGYNSAKTNGDIDIILKRYELVE
jgi:ABC-type amino acid transport substrate-binding protein